MTQLEARQAAKLSQLDEEERYRSFDELQLTMPGVWESMRLDMEDESVVVVPSISIERTTPGSGTIMQAMEERALFLLLLLRQPRPAHDLRDLAADSRIDHRVLPRVAARRDSQPRPRPAHPGPGRRRVDDSAECETACAAPASARDQDR